MRQVIYICLSLLSCAGISAQIPQSFTYQAVIRDDGGGVISNQVIGIQISILQGSVSGTPVYTESFIATTNTYGLINLDIGKGMVVNGDFSGIDWGDNSYFIKIEMDATGGTNYTEMGISQLLSVPYAFYAGRVENISEVDPVFGGSVACGINGSDTANWNMIKSKGMGVWCKNSTDTIYQAESDGFLYCVSNETNQCSGHIVHLYIGQYQHVLKKFLAVDTDMMFFLPVTKGSFYQVVVTVEPDCMVQDPSVTLKWLPLF